MAIAAKDVATYIANQGLGTLNTDIFVGFLPPAPDNAIMVLASGGVATPDELVGIKQPTFQVTVRNSNYENGLSKIDSIRTLLNGVLNTAINPGQTHFLNIMANSEPGHLGKDDRGRQLFSINFRAKTR